MKRNNRAAVPNEQANSTDQSPVVAATALRCNLERKRLQDIDRDVREFIFFAHATGQAARLKSEIEWAQWLLDRAARDAADAEAELRRAERAP